MERMEHKNLPAIEKLVLAYLVNYSSQEVYWSFCKDSEFLQDEYRQLLGGDIPVEILFTGNLVKIFRDVCEVQMLVHHAEQALPKEKRHVCQNKSLADKIQYLMSLQEGCVRIETRPFLKARQRSNMAESKSDLNVSSTTSTLNPQCESATALEQTVHEAKSVVVENIPPQPSNKLASASILEDKPETETRPTTSSIIDTKVFVGRYKLDSPNQDQEHSKSVVSQQPSLSPFGHPTKPIDEPSLSPVEPIILQPAAASPEPPLRPPHPSPYQNDSKIFRTAYGSALKQSLSLAAAKPAAVQREAKILDHEIFKNQKLAARLTSNIITIPEDGGEVVPGKDANEGKKSEDEKFEETIRKIMERVVKDPVFEQTVSITSTIINQRWDDVLNEHFPELMTTSTQ